MPIEDEIDLTIDRRFGEDRSFFIQQKLDAKNKLFGSRVYDSRQIGRLHDHFGFLPRSTFLPWNSRKVDKLEETYRDKRSYGDPLSDDFGNTVRTTSSNNIMVLGKSVFPEVLEEFFMETYGMLPFTNMGICYDCGAYSIIPSREYGFRPCNKCMRNRRNIPWERS